MERFGLWGLSLLVCVVGSVLSGRALGQGFECSIGAQLGHAVVPGDALDVDVDDGLAFVANKSGGFLIFDVAAPDDPTLLSSYPSGDREYLSVEAAGSVAVVGTDAGVLLVFDISDPAMPVLLDETPCVADVRGLWLEGTLLYVGGRGIQVFDLADPTSPVLLGERGTAPFRSITIRGDRACLAYGSSLVIYDISDPASIGLLVSHDVDASVWNADLAGLVAYVTTSDGMLLLDITDPSEPQPLGGVTLPAAGEAVAVVGEMAYVAVGDYGVFAVGVSDPSAPVVLGWYDTWGVAMDVCEIGGLLYVADFHRTLVVLDVFRGTPALVPGVHRTVRNAFAVDASGDLACVAVEFEGLELYDVSELGRPVLLSQIWGLGQAVDVRLVGDVAYVAGGSATLTTVDVSDPTNPAVLGSLYDDSGYRVEVDGGYAYLTGNELLVVDVSDPAAPALVGISEGLVSARSVTIAGDRAYVGDFDGLYLFDISDPTAPVQVSKLATPSYPTGSSVVGDVAYVSVESEGLWIVSYADPESPRVLATVDDGAFPWPGWGQVKDVSVRDGVAWLATRHAGLQLIDVTDSAAPFWMGSFTPEEYEISCVRVDGSRVYSTSPGLRMYALEAGRCVPCVADWDGDGVVDTRDFLAYLEDWAAREPVADVTGDGVVDTRDFLEFLGLWASGC